ncbi:hypothetical protein A2210_02665 [Candidatus Woesebacteria bacterium RIFOXYA1_FULL_40_18]|uniref:SH3b domain-containing protein n=2 Tax=Candidatus Woeseibacteriota TaxID=1752722 RepID=A0A1F8CLW8_9BACT|nr:MAG: hypothetical protein UT72_C0007G0004 [Candidatus Woesebacteria bacterium GW2011_GWB1_40_101]OGM77231.1 MAG: hypothetical protein A2210_02665 [Candidatus Woesebacteria bacterium RIFOXYA1_FULL_40_18]
MRKLSIVLAITGGIILLVGVSLFLLGFFKPKLAGISITTTPAATVFIDNVQVGRTPYEGTSQPGEVTVKLVPESADIPLSPYETKVVLSSGIKTVIKREFAETEEKSSGEIISFEKVGGSEASLAVISIPDSAQVAVDGVSRGFAPVKVSSINPTEHQVVVSRPGYGPRSISIKALAGFKLTLFVKLAPDGANPSPTPAPIEIEEKATFIQILSTPTGFLRVRSEPGSGGVELAQVKPSEEFPFIEDDKATGWFKIEYQKGKQGWVSNQYSKKVEKTTLAATPSPSPSPTPKPAP